MICALAACLPMTSCRSVSETVRTVVPDITFPVFPALERTVNDDGSWVISRESVDLLAEYYIDIQKTEKNYREIKSLLEEEI